MTKTHLTSKEYEIMKVLWSSDRPMLISDILSLTETVSENSIHHMINSLERKGFVKVAGSMRVVKTPGRLYAPAITVAEYAALQSSEIFKTTNQRFDVKNFLLCLTKQSKNKNNDMMNEIEEFIKNHKKNTDNRG
ncbi:MAG: BlaI/MecI/CopY family transcriptional regulator [Clostridia bacterium]|nr:BlaI/MecI/CopY family transcriptional regulator [Clostridia bacterium]